MKYDYDKILDNLRLLRLKRRLKQSEIAEVINVSHSMYSIFETRKCTLDAKQLLELLNYYKISLEDLMND